MEYTEKLKNITKILSLSQKVNAFNKNGEKECEVLAHSLLDIEESSKEIIENLIPKLTSNDLSEIEVEDILYDIGEELRHIVYHIDAPYFYKYIGR